MTGVAQERMELLIRQLLREFLSSRTTITRFVLVGGTGYLTYQAVLFAVYDSPVFWFLPAKDTAVSMLLFDHGDIRFLIATLVATAVALIGVFTGHNLWTFRDSSAVRKPLLVRFGQFVAAALPAALGIITVTVNVLTVQFGMYHFVALPIGVALGAVWDWLWYSRFIWRRARAEHADARGG